MATVAVFGDLSGHSKPLYEALENLDVDLAVGTIPEGLTIVQLGDLVHRGPDGDEAVAFVDRMLEANPGQWIQLLGNHEAHHLGGPRFGVCDCGPATVSTLGRWLADDRAQLAVALELEDGNEVLVTHAGLTCDRWLSLGSPRTAAEAAEAINEQLREDRKVAFAAGDMLHGFEDDLPGVVWAGAGGELYASWTGRYEPPFDQAHGHSSALDWDRGQWYLGMPRQLERGAIVDPLTRHLTVTIGNAKFHSIDPCYGRHDPSWPLVPLVLQGKVAGRG